MSCVLLVLLVCLAKYASAFSLPKHRPLIRRKGNQRKHKGSSSKVFYLDESPMHIVYSTGCNAYQHYQSWLLLHSAAQIKQPGTITHIIVGCEESTSSAHELVSTHQKGDADRIIPREVWERELAFPNVRLHFVPATPMAAKFPWFNKPWSYYDWITKSPPRDPDSIVALIDPDEWFMRPLTNDPFTTEEMLPPKVPLAGISPDWIQKIQSTAGINVVKEGHPVSQIFGIGGFQRFDRNKICGAGSKCAAVTNREAMDYYQVGPPYIMHLNDVKKVFLKWWEYMPGAYEQLPREISVDMYAYTMASAQFGLKHVPLRNYMVSNEDCPEFEAWEWVEDLETMSCHGVSVGDDVSTDAPMPTFLHAASTYKATMRPPYRPQTWSFHKGRVPTQILDCDHPLLVPPPDHFYDAIKGSPNPFDRRNAFMVCALINKVNAGALAYKEKFCKPGYNTQKCVVILNTDTGETLPECGSKENPLCYPQARNLCLTGELKDGNFDDLYQNGMRDFEA